MPAGAATGADADPPDPSMHGALPPGAWWEVANGAEPVFEPYADRAGEAAVAAARAGDLELVNVSSSYPVRKEMAGALEPGSHSDAALARHGTCRWCCMMW